MKRVFLFSLMALVCLWGITSCGDKDDESVALTSITVSPTSLNLLVGSMQQLTATAVPGNATGVAFAWSSNNEAVATVGASGLVTAAGLGSAVITVSSGSVSATVPVTVVMEAIPLVSINTRVENEAVDALTLPLDGTVTVTAAPVPANATGVVFVWTSADEEVATVDQTGLITITGVGATTVTVTSGTVSKTINVTGTIKSVTINDPDGEEAGQYGIGSVLQLRAIIDPGDTGDVAEWATSNPEVAIVSDLGLVTVTSSGIVTITATVGAFSAIYTLTTESVYDEAIGYWRFDDPENIGKATKGTDLIVNGTVTISEDSPSAGNLAIEGTKGEHNLEWWHETSPVPNSFTILMDTRFFGIRQYYTLYWDGSNSDGSFFFRVRSQKYDYDDDGVEEADEAWMLTAGRGNYFKIMDLPEGDTTNWMRVVVVIEMTPADENGIYTVYVDGKPIETSTGRPLGNLWMFTWRENAPIYFLSDGSGNDGDDAVQPVASIAVWDRALTDQEVASLGGVK
jgi:uncharacterized protein YjdB